MKRLLLLVIVMMLAAGVDSAAPSGSRRITFDRDARAAGTDDPGETIEHLLARRLVQHAGRFARTLAGEDPHAGFRTAVGILKAAAELAPDDVEIHRRLATAAIVGNGDPAIAAAADRDLLRLEPDHASAQWRIIARAIDERQSVTDRLDLCRRLLDSSAAARLSREVKSNIAYRAAILAQEQGRASVAASWLEEALRHNPANLDAAGLRALEVDRTTERREVLVKALIALVKADPLNIPALSDLIAAVKDAGFYRGAADLIEAMSALASRRGENIPDDLFADYALLRAAAEGGAQVGLDLIAQRQHAFDRAERARLQSEWYRGRQQAYQQALQEGRLAPPVEEMPSFADVTVDLSLHLQITRALLAAAADAPNEVDEAMSRLESRWERMIGELDTADRSALPSTAAAALENDRRRLIADRTWIRLWVGRNPERAAADLALLEQDGQMDRAELQRLRGWAALRRAEPQAAVAWLEPLASTDSLSALGLALAHEQAGRSAEAARVLGEIHLAQSGTLLGVLCKWRCEAIQSRTLPLTREARSVEKELGRFPQTLADLILRPQRHFSLSIAPAATRIDPFGAIRFEVTIRNDSPWPAAIGPGRIIPNRLAVFPVFRLAGRQLNTGSAPLTLDLQRRQMLMPSESLSIPLALDHTRLGMLIPSLAVKPLTLELQAMLDFQVKRDGSVAPLPWSLVRQSSPMHITPWFETLSPRGEGAGPRFPADDLLLAMRHISEVGAVIHSALVRTLDRERDAALIAEAEADLATLIDLWPNLDPRVAAWAVLTLPFQAEGAEKRFEVLDRFEAAARRSTDPLLQLAWITARTDQADDVVIASALRSNEPALRTLAADARAFLSRSLPEEVEPLAEPDAPEPDE